MYHSNYYKYEKDGIVCVSGELPEGATLVEAMDILNADEGKTLVRISDEEDEEIVGNSVWLHDGDVETNYREEDEES